MAQRIIGPAIALAVPDAKLYAEGDAVRAELRIREASTSKRLWHAYYYYGFDTDETCAEQDYK